MFTLCHTCIVYFYLFNTNILEHKLLEKLYCKSQKQHEFNFEIIKVNTAIIVLTVTFTYNRFFSNLLQILQVTNLIRITWGLNFISKNFKKLSLVESFF